jgi:uncharacterized protein
MNLHKLRPLLILLMIAVSLSVFAEKITDIHPVNYVTDLAGVLDSATAARINAVAGDVERKTGAQIAVVTVNSLEGRPIEDYSVDLYKHLGVGHKDDRGVLLLVAPPERKYRIEVGYGLEPVINDARAGDIGREMVPYLRQGDYNGAIELASGRLATRIADASNVKLDQAPATVRPSGSRSESDSESEFPWWIIFPIGFFVVPILLRALTKGGRRGGRRGSNYPWWLGPGGFGGGGGGWGTGGGGSFGGSSGGFDFGGFGGGSSGGGGASGSW